MAKQSGLGDNFYVNGYDLSGDVSAIGQLGGGPALGDVTGIKSFANERLGLVRTGDWQFTSFMESNPTAAAPGVPLSGTPVVSTFNYPVIVTVTGGTGTQVSINGVNQGTFDGSYFLPALGTITLTYSAAPTWTWLAVGAEHQALSGLPRGDVIGTYFRGTSTQNKGASINGVQINYDPTRDAQGNLSLGVEIQSDKFGMEWGELLTPGLRTDKTGTTGPAIDDGASSAFGAQAYVQLTGFVGTSVTIDIQHATTSGGSYSSIFSPAALTAIGAARYSVTNTTTINEFLKVITSGTFTYAQFAVLFCRNPIAGVVF